VAQTSEFFKNSEVLGLRSLSAVLLLICLVSLARPLWSRAQVRPAIPDLRQGGAASYGLTWWTVDGGGTTLSRGDGYALGGTIGQPDAGVLRGGGYTLAGGFWGGGEVAAGDHRIYLPLVLRQ
jgi:hypothetical protein